MKMHLVNQSTKGIILCITNWLRRMEPNEGWHCSDFGETPKTDTHAYECGAMPAWATERRTQHDWSIKSSAANKRSRKPYFINDWDRISGTKLNYDALIVDLAIYIVGFHRIHRLNWKHLPAFHSPLHCTVIGIQVYLKQNQKQSKIKQCSQTNLFLFCVCVCVNFRCCFKSLLSKIQLLSTLKKLQQSIHQNRLFYFTLIWAFFITFLFFSLSLSLFELITFHGSERRGKKIYEKKAKKKEEKKQAIEHNEQYKF